MNDPHLREELMMLYEQLSAYPEVKGVLKKLREKVRGLRFSPTALPKC